MNITGIILAAGQSSRFGGVKALAKFQGKSLLQHAIDSAVTADIGQLQVVLGAHHDIILSNTDLSNCGIIRNPDYQLGMSSSIKTATIAHQKDHALLFMTVDQPLINSDHLNSLITSFSKTGRTTAARYCDAAGIPSVFSQDEFPALLALTGDKGAKVVLQDCAPELIDLPEAEFDIDRPEDLLTLPQQSNRP